MSKNDKDKKISLPGFEKIKKSEFLKKKREDILKAEKDFGLLASGNASVSKRQEKLDRRKSIREHITKMHEDALTDILGLDNPRKELCVGCYSVLTSDFFIYSNSPEIKLCRKCYQSLARCDNCGRPVMKAVKGMSVHFCKYCKSSKECSSCGKEINPKEGIRIEGVRGFYCHDCAESQISCFFCSAKLADEKNKIAEGVYICPHCLKSSVVSSNECAVILDEVNSFLTNKLKIRHERVMKTGLTVLDNAWESLYKSVEGDGFTYVVFQSGTPHHIIEGLFSYIIAKKFIEDKLLNTQEESVYDGFGNFIMYNYYSAKGYFEEAHKVKKRELNKEALQHFFKLESRLGFSKVISTIKKGLMPLCI